MQHPSKSEVLTNRRKNVPYNDNYNDDDDSDNYHDDGNYADDDNDENEDNDNDEEDNGSESELFEMLGMGGAAKGPGGA